LKLDLSSSESFKMYQNSNLLKQIHETDSINTKLSKESFENKLVNEVISLFKWINPILISIIVFLI
jgi:hypothetical protein